MLGLAAMIIICGGMKAGCHTVKFHESGREPGDRSTVFVKLLNFLNGIHDKLLCRPQVDLDVVVCERENLLFNAVQQSVHLLVGVVAVAYHAVAGHDHLTKEVLLADDVDVVVRVGGGRNEGEEITEIFGTADFVELSAIFQGLL